MAFLLKQFGEVGFMAALAYPTFIAFLWGEAFANLVINRNWKDFKSEMWMLRGWKALAVAGYSLTVAFVMKLVGVY